MGFESLVFRMTDTTVSRPAIVAPPTYPALPAPQLVERIWDESWNLLYDSRADYPDPVDYRRRVLEGKITWRTAHYGSRAISTQRLDGIGPGDELVWKSEYEYIRPFTAWRSPLLDD